MTTVMSRRSETVLAILSIVLFVVAYVVMFFLVIPTIGVGPGELRP